MEKIKKRVSIQNKSIRMNMGIRIHMSIQELRRILRKIFG